MIQFIRKVAVPVMSAMLVCGCQLDEGCICVAASERKKFDAIVRAYKDIWHSFYDEENLVRMLVVASEKTCLSLPLNECEEEGVLKDRITIRLNEESYSEWKEKADKMLVDAGASSYVVNDMHDGCRAICGRAYQFPVEVEARLAEFDRIVEKKHLERFVVKATLFDRDDIFVSSITVPDFKFYLCGGGWCSLPYTLPFHHLSRTQDLFALYGDREERETVFSCADTEHENVDFFDDRYFCVRLEYEIKKEYDPLSYASVSDESGIVVSNIISNMVQVPGEKCLVCRYEVTQKEWSALMGSNPSGNIGGMKPVERITWFEARLFIDVINSLPETQKAGLMFYIPSSEEWSYACYGTRDSKAQYKASKTGLDSKGWFEFNSNGRTHEVGLKEHNAFGLYDMLGNVFEYSCDTRESKGNGILPRDLSYVPCGGSYESASNWMDGSKECAAERRYADVGLRLFAVKVPSF